jgi:hypothetical protein
LDSGLVETLKTLRDIKGVQGSFVVRAQDGHLLGRDLPAVIDDAVLSSVGPRIDRLLNIVDSQPPTETIAMRFGDHRLDVKRMPAAHLCVLADVAVSAPALRMAVKLVSRKLDSYNWASPPPAAAPESKEPSAPGRTVQFRGGRTTL